MTDETAQLTGWLLPSKEDLLWSLTGASASLSLAFLGTQTRYSKRPLLGLML